MSRWSEAVALVRGHPYATAGIVFVGGAVLVYIYYSSGSSTPAATADSSQTDFIKAQLISEQTQAQYGAQISAQQIQEQAVATQVQGAVAIDANRNAASVSIAGLAAGVTNNQTAATKAIDLSQIGAMQTVDLAQIGSNTAHDAALFGWMNNASMLAAQTSQMQITANAAKVQSAADIAYSTFIIGLAGTQTPDTRAASAQIALQTIAGVGL